VTEGMNLELGKKNLELGILFNLELGVGIWN
jgi:hypothetical protein